MENELLILEKGPKFEIHLAALETTLKNTKLENSRFR